MSRSRWRRSSHSARVAQTRRVARRLPRTVCVSQIFSLGSLLFFASVAAEADDSARRANTAIDA
jgi:hypothetical protein